MKTVRKKRLLHRITRKNILGKGKQGIVYNVVNTNGIHYALKSGDIGEHEIEFAETVAVKYPNHFMILYDHDKETLIYSKIDLTFRDYLQHSKLSNTVLYDLYIQMMYIICILQKEGWTHHDFHSGNIGLVKTKDETIEIKGHRIPTHGYYVQAIDYGSVVHSVLPYRDLYRLFASYVYDTHTHTYKDIWSIQKKPFLSFQKKKIQQYLPTSTDMKEQWRNNDISFVLFQLLYPTDFKKAYPSIDKFIYLPTKVMLYIIKHIDTPTRCLDYLIAHR